MWNKFLNRRVRLIVEDGQFPRPKDGVLVSIDETHVWLKVDGKKLPIPFSRVSIKRMEDKDAEEEYGPKT